MEIKMNIGHELTLEEMCALNEMGFEFAIEGGEITNAIYK